MYGAILGDIIGSPFEFDRGAKTKDFELFTKGCQFTVYSTMKLPKKSVRIPHFQQGNFPIKSGTY